MQLGQLWTLLTKGWSFRQALRSWVSRLNAMPDMICGHLQIQVMLSELHTDQQQALNLGWGGLEPNYRLRHQHFAKWSKQLPINNINYDQIVQCNLRLCSTVLNFGVLYRMFVCLKTVLWLKVFNIATYMITLAVKLFIESNILFWNLTLYMTWPPMVSHICVWGGLPTDLFLHKT